MAKRKDKVPGTPAPKEPEVIDAEENEVIELPPETMPPLMELIFHVAEVNVQKFNTPQGKLNRLTVQAPNGIVATILLTEAGAENLIKELKGTQIDTYTIVPK